MKGFRGIMGGQQMDKIDRLAVKGLRGVEHSLAYKVDELLEHFHGSQDWFGKAASPNGTHFADDITGGTLAPFQIDAGSDAWGSTWLQILGSGDTPNRKSPDMTRFHLDKLQIVDSETTNIHYFIQIGVGASGAAALSSFDYTTIAYLTPTNQAAEAAVSFNMKDYPAGSLVWARGLAVGQATCKLDFYIGLSEYIG